MIRILHSVSYMNRGGIETMLMNYYRNIDRSEIQFDFLCNSPLPGAYDDEIQELGGRIFRSPGFSPLKRLAYKRFMQELFASHPEYSIVEAHNGPFGRYALKAAKDSGIPVRIYHAHGCDIPFNLKWPLKYYCKEMLRFSMNEHFVCGLKAGLYYMGKKIMGEGKYHFIPNAIDVEKFLFNENTRNNLRNRYDLNNKIIIGHIGRISLPKNHKFLLEIFARLHQINPATHLVLVGDGEWRKRIERQIESLDIKESVLMVGNVNNPHDWYQAFDLFLMPSLWEGLPVVGVEAQASDLPCVFSTAVTDEIALTEKAGFLDLKQPSEEWAKHINNIITNIPQRKNRFDLITEKHYNIRVEARKLQTLYLSIDKKIG